MQRIFVEAPLRFWTPLKASFGPTADPLSAHSWPWQVWEMVTAASNEEYDYALAAFPELCRPFAAAMGDVRSAAECLAGYEADRAAGMGWLSGTEGGRRAAERLAAAMADKLEAAADGGRRPMRLEEGSFV